MSELLTRFEEVRHDAPRRTLIHLPASQTQWSADDLWHAHQTYAERLTKIDIGSGDLVVAAAGNSPAAIALLLACRTLDAPLLLADSGTASSELMALADRLGARALCLPESLLPKDRRLDTARSSIDEGLCLCPVLDIQPRRYPGTALLKLTSGSTDVPRIAVNSETQLIADGRHIAAAAGIRPSDVQMASIPLSHTYGLGVLVLPLLLQGTAFVLRESFIPQQLPADARRFGARVFPGVPFMFQFFLATPIADGWPASLTTLISAGAPLKPATVRAFHDRFGLKIHSLYGTSETGAIAFDADDEITDSATVGVALPGVAVTLLDKEDVKGRIHVASAAVATGYLDGPNDAFASQGFLTSDYGAWDDDGRLVLGGRVSSFVNVAGHKVRPDEVEEVLRAMPGIAEVRVLGADDPRRGQQIVACIVAERAGAIPALAVRRFCAARLAPHKIPRAVVFLDAIPTTARGKVDRAALAVIVRSRLDV